MASYEDTKTLAIRELDACRALLEGATDWTGVTPCEGWDVEGLSRHLAAVAWQQAEAFHRARIHVTTAPSWLEVAGDRDAVLDTLAVDRAHLAAGLAEVTDEQRTVPLPFAQLPASIAAAGLVLEYGVHRADLERAIDGAPAGHLDPDVAAVVAPLLPLLVPVLAQKDPVTPITYRLVGDTVTASISWHEGTWRADEGNEPVCELRGSDAAVSLLALGRISPDDNSLTVTDPTGVAAALTDHIRPL